MRWSYKTVHYELKKEGLLGSSFLDESEVEISLNEYGKSGWELVSMLETMDGLIAVFKQPLSLDTESFYPPLQEEKKEQEEEALPVQEEFAEEPLSKEDNDTYDEGIVVVEDFDVIEDLEVEPVEAKNISKPGKDVGSIVIE